MKACVVGAGAVGGWIACALAESGAETSLLARGETLQALRSEGLNIRETGGDRNLALSVSDDPDQLGPQDVVAIAVKAPALPGLAASLSPLIGPDTLIVPMLNGVPWWFTGERLRTIDPDGAIAAALPLQQVVGCVVHASCKRTAPNRVEIIHADRLILGEPGGGTSERVDSLCLLFAKSGLRCEQSADIRRAIWYKLWGNATINPLSALTRSTADKLLADPRLRAFMAEAMDDLAAIGAAIGCPINESAEDRMAVTARLGAFKSSMLQDVEAGRALEIEALVGAPLEIAANAGIPAPQLQRIYAMIRLLAENCGLA